MAARAAPITRESGGILSGEEPAEQAGQDLAAGEVAGAAEDDEVEGLDRDHARDHLPLR
jgi:hypothetical protein